MSLLENLDAALEDVQMQHVHCENIEQLVTNVSDLESQVKDAKRNLNIAVDKMCADLATEIRQLQPGLTVILKTNCCDIGYKTKYVSCIAKPFEGCWDFNAYEFGRHFAKRYPHCCRLSCPLSDIASCLAEYFNNNYRSLS